MSGISRSPPLEVILSPATPPMSTGSTLVNRFGNLFWQAAGTYVGQGTVPASRRAFWLALGHRGRLRTCTREIEGSRRRCRTRKRSGRQLQRLLPLLQARPQFWLLWTVATWKCTYHRRAGSRTANLVAASISTRGDDPRSAGPCEATRTPEQHGRRAVVECLRQD